MLASLRRTTRTWAAGAILFLALMAIVITGFGTGGMGGLGSIGGGGSGASVARVEGENIGEQELTDVINREYNRARQQQPTLDMHSFLAGRTFEEILRQTLIGKAIMAFGRAQGLIVSQRMIDREIVNIPAFRNFAGQFDDATFRRALDSQNIREADLREDIARSLMQRQLLLPIGLGAATPESVAREYAALLLERRQGTIGVVPTELMAQGIAPTDAEVAAYYARNRDRFSIPERRVIRYAMIDRSRIAQAATATDAEVAAYYRQHAAQYGPRETRDLQSVVIQDRAAAQAFAQRVRGGGSFADAASAAGFGPTDIAFPNQNRGQFAQATAPQVATAAFGAAQGAVIGPIQSELGFHIVRIERVNTVPGRPLQNVRVEIAQAIEQRKTADLLGALITRIDDQIADGASVEEIARTQSLQLVTTPPITASGQSPDQPFVVPPELSPLLRSAFEIDADDPEPVVETITPDQRFALIGIERVVPAAPPPLARIQAQVRAVLVQQRALERGRAIAQAIADRINRGMPAALAYAAAQPRVPPPQSVNLRRVQISQGGQQVPPPLLTLFSIPQGRARILPAPNGQGWYVVHHAQRTAGEAATEPRMIETTRAEFSRAAPEEIAQQFARAVELQSEISRNQDALRRLRQRLAGSAE